MRNVNTGNASRRVSKAETLRYLLICCWLGLLLLWASQALIAQDVSNVPCDQLHAIARIARAKSLGELGRAKQNAGSSYRAKIVFAARSFELQPSDKSVAVLLLNLLPRDDAQNFTLMTLGDSLCDDESVAEMMSLSRIRDRLSRDFAKAVLLALDMLPDYVAYASTSVLDPHSDYAVQMQTVCRAKHPEFAKAVAGLSTDRRDWFVKHVFNPEGCHALALPEAE